MLLAPTVYPVLRGFEPLPTGDHGRDAGLFPFWVARRLGELVDPREQRIDEPRDLLVAVGIFRPIERDQEDAGGDRLNFLARRQQVRIFLAGELRWEVEVLEPRIV